MRAQDRMINSKQTSNNQQHVTAMGGGGDGRQRTKTMTAAAIATAMAEEAVGRQRLRRRQGRGNSGRDSSGGDKGKTAATSGHVVRSRTHHLPARIYGIFGEKKISFFWFRRNLGTLCKHNKKLGN